MGYTSKDGRVRVDLFKQTGKWYATGSVDMSSFWDHDDLFMAVKLAMEQEKEKGPEGEWPVVSTWRGWLEQGGFIVILKPHHKWSHPICINSF